MTDAPRLTLLTPHRVGPEHVDALLPALERACGAGDVAAVILRLAPADERSLIALVKRVAPAVQAAGAALVVAAAGFPGDLVSVSARGGADGIHVDKPEDGTLQELRGRLRDGRILGVGGIETRHAAMDAGEAGIDYLMFGGLYPDGVAAEPEAVRERTAWWAEIFETPCIGVACAETEIAGLAATGAEFVGLESGLWMDDPARIATLQTSLSEVAS
ncbi:thiamine phosphate synthase [Methylobacterium sp. E-041]|uniref:thiamine phosphate synthase n=1 Tax=Methylobacterium sp. E-041 TaxID=2836573 RepID=UPI001FB869DA|nr:thiamine phosphate synthase [Methylobacterium sp. E-041]MCJ2109352.1 thiamine phosphate synthase [Methylobacterium sp. E-041]